jgi:MOSC domain-containing protein YiiM
MPTAIVLSVNLGEARPDRPPRRGQAAGLTAIDKRSVAGPVEVRAPGPRRDGLGSGLVGDAVCNRRYHGGDDQAVYAFAREDLDAWATELGRPLAPGCFGENLTTLGVDISGALIGERWRAGDGVLLEVSVPRIPCGTFAARMKTLGVERGWVRRFTLRAAPGTYLRVLAPGRLQAGDLLEVVQRPTHQVTVALAFRALTREPALLPRLLDATALPDDVLRKARAHGAPAG